MHVPSTSFTVSLPKQTNLGPYPVILGILSAGPSEADIGGAG